MKTGMWLAGMLPVLLMSSKLQADVVGVRIGADMMRLNPIHRVGDAGHAAGFSQQDQTDMALFGRLEHPLPLLPNLAVRYQQTDLTGQQVLTAPAQLGGQGFTTGADVRQQSRSDLLDMSAYYEILDNPLGSLDIGITLRKLQADIDWQTSAREGQADLSVFTPLLYLDAELAVWGTDTHLFVNGNYGRYQSDLNYDWRIGVAWRIVDVAMFQLFVRAGWQQAEHQYSNRDQLDFTSRYHGAFVGLIADF